MEHPAIEVAGRRCGPPAPLRREGVRHGRRRFAVEEDDVTAVRRQISPACPSGHVVDELPHNVAGIVPAAASSVRGPSPEGLPRSLRSRVAGASGTL